MNLFVYSSGATFLLYSLFVPSVLAASTEKQSINYGHSSLSLRYFSIVKEKAEVTAKPNPLANTTNKYIFKAKSINRSPVVGSIVIDPTTGAYFASNNWDGYRLWLGSREEANNELFGGTQPLKSRYSSIYYGNYQPKNQALAVNARDNNNQYAFLNHYEGMAIDYDYPGLCVEYMSTPNTFTGPDKLWMIPYIPIDLKNCYAKSNSSNPVGILRYVYACRILKQVKINNSTTFDYPYFVYIDRIPFVVTKAFKGDPRPTVSVLGWIVPSVSFARARKNGSLTGVRIYPTSAMKNSTFITKIQESHKNIVSLHCPSITLLRTHIKEIAINVGTGMTYHTVLIGYASIISKFKDEQKHHKIIKNEPLVVSVFLNLEGDGARLQQNDSAEVAHLTIKDDMKDKAVYLGGLTVVCKDRKNSKLINDCKRPSKITNNRLNTDANVKKEDYIYLLYAADYKNSRIIQFSIENNGRRVIKAGKVVKLLKENGSKLVKDNPLKCPIQLYPAINNLNYNYNNSYDFNQSSAPTKTESSTLTKSPVIYIYDNCNLWEDETKSESETSPELYKDPPKVFEMFYVYPTTSKDGYYTIKDVTNRFLDLADQTADATNASSFLTLVASAAAEEAPKYIDAIYPGLNGTFNVLTRSRIDGIDKKTLADTDTVDKIDYTLTKLKVDLEDYYKKGQALDYGTNNK